MDVQVTLAALLYGDYPGLAARLLESIPVSPRIKEIRIGLNEVSAATNTYFRQWAESFTRRPGSAPVLYWYTDKNTGKYRVMREMLYGTNLQSGVDHWMWFDDDSYFLTAGAVDADSYDSWWSGLDALFAPPSVVQVGAIHRIKQRGVQFEYIQRQRWYTGLAVSPNHKFTFATGGWWVANTTFLREHNYPFPELYHNGGDSILGEVIRQQGKEIASSQSLAVCGCESCQTRSVVPLGALVKINQGGRAGRRGIGRTGEHYVGSSIQPPAFPAEPVLFGGLFANGLKFRN